MTWSRTKELRRASLGLVVALWVILIAYAAARAATAGPQWGLHLTEDNAGKVVASDVSIFGVGQTIEQGSEIVAVDGADPHDFLGKPLSEVHDVSFRDATGKLSTIRVDDVSRLQFGFLAAGGLLFALLGAVVHRWSAGPLLGRLFLLS